MSTLDKIFNNTVDEMLVYAGAKPATPEIPEGEQDAPPPPPDAFTQGVSDILKRFGVHEPSTSLTFDAKADTCEPPTDTVQGPPEEENTPTSVMGGNTDTADVSLTDDGYVSFSVNGVTMQLDRDAAESIASQILDILGDDDDDSDDWSDDDDSDEYEDGSEWRQPNEVAEDSDDEDEEEDDDDSDDDDDDDDDDDSEDWGDDDDSEDEEDEDESGGHY